MAGSVPYGFLQEVRQMKKVITIGREFGSGGREIGRRIAEKLQIGDECGKRSRTFLTKNVSLCRCRMTRFFALLFYELFWTDAAITRCVSRSPQRYRSFSHPVQQQFDTAFQVLVFATLVQLRLNAFSRYLPVRSVLLVKRPFAFENLQ